MSPGSLPDLPLDIPVASNLETIIAVSDGATNIKVQNNDDTTTTYTFNQYDIANRAFYSFYYRYWDSYTGEFVQPTNYADLDNPTTTAQQFRNNFADYCRWADYPGEKVVQSNDITVNGNLIDQYDTNSQVYYREAFIPKEKMHAYRGLVGQQQPVKAVSPSDGAYEGVHWYNDGLQTPKLEHAPVDFYTPFLFWFNMGLSQAFISAAIPYGQRFINTTIAPSKLLADKFPRYKLVTIIRKHTYNGTMSPPGPTIPVYPVTDTNNGDQLPFYDIQQFIYAQDVLTDGKMNYPSFKNMQLLMYNVFLPVSVHNVCVSKIIYKMYKRRIMGMKPLNFNARSQTVSVVDLKFPCEFVFWGIRIIPNDLTTQNLQNIYWNLEDYCKFHRTYRNTVVQPDFNNLLNYKIQFSDGTYMDPDRIITGGMERHKFIKYNDNKTYFESGAMKAQ